ncbi:MAG TPA: hypothetical protein VGM86_24290 [Thermoanaerobaculia bacterium]
MPPFTIENLPREAAHLQILSRLGNVWLVIENGHIYVLPLGDGPGPNDPSPLRALEITAKTLEIAIPQVQRQLEAHARH